jgi:hypothetical protein
MFIFFKKISYQAWGEKISMSFLEYMSFMVSRVVGRYFKDKETFQSNRKNNKINSLISFLHAQ